MRISRKQLVKIISEELHRAGFKTLAEAPAYKPSGAFKKTDLFDDEEETEPAPTEPAADDEDDTDYNPW
jgi:hypothetical protein